MSMLGGNGVRLEIEKYIYIYVYLHCEEMDDVAEGIDIYNQMHSTKYY